MRPKTYVAIGLIVSILVFGLIIISGISTKTLLPIFLLSFLMIFFASCIFIFRKSLDNNILAVSILLLLIAISATIFLTSLKTYYDVVNVYGTPDNAPDIGKIQSEINYYSAYANYLNQLITVYQNRTKTMEDQLTALERLQQTNQANVNQNIIPQSTILNATPQIVDNSTINQISTPESSYIPNTQRRDREGYDD